MVAIFLDGHENQFVPIFCVSFSVVLFRREHIQLDILSMPGGNSSQRTWC